MSPLITTIIIALAALAAGILAGYGDTATVIGRVVEGAGCKIV
jgi:hypothetical protein